VIKGEILVRDGCVKNAAHIRKGEEKGGITIRDVRPIMDECAAVE